MDGYTNRAHKFNALIMWAFAAILAVTAYFNGGLSQMLTAAVLLVVTCCIVTGFAFLKVKNNFIKSLIISLLPAIGVMLYSASQGGLERMFTAYLVCACFAAVYFNKNVILTYGVALSVILIAVYAIRPEALLGSNSGFGEFFPRFGMYFCGTVALYFLARWGNEHLLDAQKESEKAQLLNKNLTNVIDQVNITTDSLFENVSKCNDNILENQQGVAGVTRSVQEISKAVEDSAVAVNNVNSYVLDSSRIINETFNLSKEVEKEFASTSEVVAAGSRETDEMREHMDIMSQAIESAVEAVTQLQEKMDLIGGFLDNITDIASQTNMLALNAAIEAARAGEFGKGFAVVADEIRQLADQSSKAAKEIHDITAEAQQTTDNAIEQVQKGNASVIESNAKVDDVVEIFGKVRNSINSVNSKLYAEYEMMNNVAERFSYMQEQLETLAATSEENSASTQQVLAMTMVQDEAIKSTAEIVRQIKDLGQALKDQL